MSWKAGLDQLGGGDLTFLSEDGEAVVFVVVGDLVVLEGKFKGKPQVRAGIPIVTEDGFFIFITGKRLARKIGKYEKHFDDTAFMAVRHGEQGDIESRYELKLVESKEITDSLFAVKVSEFKPTMIADAVKAANDIMKQ